MKKRGFGVGRWNGVGGKVNEVDGESVETAAVREAQEEIGIVAKNFSKIAELTFTFPHNKDWDQVVHVYFCTEWQGEPKESEEMNPQWFSVADIPYADMWPDDILWLPKVIEGNLIEASFTFGEKDTILAQDVRIVPELAKKNLKA